jgi:hypothetical protein
VWRVERKRNDNRALGEPVRETNEEVVRERERELMKTDQNRGSYPYHQEAEPQSFASLNWRRRTEAS